MLVSVVMDYALSSRDGLADELLAAGPDAPTLCEGWEARHLAAHLLLREHSVWAAGIIGGPLRRGMERRLEALADEANTPAAFARLVSRFRAGPGKISPRRSARIDNAANVIEYFVHTEDVRRARDRWAPRALETGYEEKLWQLLIQRAGMMYSGAGVGVILVRADGRRSRVARGANSVAIFGETGELVMHANGRTEHALVSFEGSPEVVAKMRAFQAHV